MATLFWASKRKSQSPATGLYANEVSNKYGGRHAKPFTKSLRLPNIDFTIAGKDLRNNSLASNFFLQISLL